MMVSRERAGFWIAGRANKEIEKKDETYEKFGYKVDADKMLQYRLEMAWQFGMEQLDESIDIEDRVNMKSTEIEIIHKAWGRGADNPEWTIRYNAWNKLHGVFWESYVDRRPPEYRRMVVIRQHVDFPLPENSKNMVWVVKTVKKSTAAALQRLYNEEGKDERVIVMEELGATAEPEVRSAFSDAQREEFVRKVGKSLILRCANLLTNWAYPQMDVTGKSIFVFYGAQKEREAEKTGVPTA